MLALTRKEGERILLQVPANAGEIEIIVSVADSRSGTARLGIEAPPDVKIIREELAHRPPAVEVAR